MDRVLNNGSERGNARIGYYLHDDSCGTSSDNSPRYLSQKLRREERTPSNQENALRCGLHSHQQLLLPLSLPLLASFAESRTRFPSPIMPTAFPQTTTDDLS